MRHNSVYHVEEMRPTVVELLWWIGIVPIHPGRKQSQKRLHSDSQVGLCESISSEVTPPGVFGQKCLIKFSCMLKSVH